MTSKIWKTIESEQNPLYKTLVDLTSSKGIHEHGLFILSGKKLAQEILRQAPEAIEYEILHPEQQPLQTKAPLVQISKKFFQNIDTLGTKHNLFILKTPVITSTSQFSVDGIEVIAPLGDPGNMGSLIRSCAAFGVKRIHLTKTSVHPFHPKSVRAASNGFLHLSFNIIDDLDELLNQHKVYVLDQAGQSLRQTRFEKSVLVFVGEEGQGISALANNQNIARNQNIQKVSIPTQNVESLNATVAISLFLYEASQTK